MIFSLKYDFLLKKKLKTVALGVEPWTRPIDKGLSTTGPHIDL